MRKLVTTSGGTAEATEECIATVLADPRGEGFWLDVEAPEERDYRLLERVFGFHPLTIEDIQEVTERPKLDEYGSYLFLVVFTARLERDDVHFMEQHLYAGKRFVVTVHHEPQPELDALRERIRRGPELTRTDPGFLLYLVVDTLIDAMFPTLDRLDETIDEIQDTVVERPSAQLLRRIYDLKHTVIDLRRQLGAQRDLVQQLTSRLSQLHGREIGLYYRDVYDHVVRQYETVDSLRDLLTGTVDVYLSTVSVRENATMKQLTVVASLFLPLSFLTGFFGMNFAFLVDRIGSPWAFGIGVGLMGAITLVQLGIFRRRGLL
jgi:magnesium transporter